MSIWITRERPKTDRIACPWLITKFIDPGADIRYVPADQVLSIAGEVGGTSFDAPGADFTHQPNPNGSGEWCTFETMIHAHRLTDDPALTELARIVHAADVSGELDSHPFGPGLRAIGEGGPAAITDDQELLSRASFVYDALYAHCQSHTGPSKPAAN
jgi:hypothetical protein